MRLEAAIRGDLAELLRGELRLGEQAVGEALQAWADGLKGELRQETVAGGLGRRLANAWRSTVYGKGRSLGAAGLVFSKAPKLHRAFSQGVTIRSERGLWLAIPTEAAPKRGTDGKRISPSNFPEVSMGELRFVYRRGRTGLLVVDGLRARTGRRGGFARESERARTRGQTATVVMFVLVKQVRLRRRIDLDGATERWSARFPELLVGTWNRLAGGAGG